MSERDRLLAKVSGYDDEGRCLWCGCGPRGNHVVKPEICPQYPPNIAFSGDYPPYMTEPWAGAGQKGETDG